jgi:phospholipid/cholesterol/gamma-HCH transport system substrate-binding protein
LLRSAVVGRVLAIVAISAAIAVVTLVLLHPGGRDYVVRARFADASQLVKGNLVQVAGVKVGSVSRIRLTDDGQAEVAMKIDDAEYAPLRRGTRAIIRQASLSGVANRYIDLQLPPGTQTQTIRSNGVIGQGETTTAVDLDQLFNTFDPSTRKALSGFIRGENDVYAGRGAQAGAGWAYLNPALAASDRLFKEVNVDTPMLQRFIGATAGLVTDVAQRREQLSGLATTSRRRRPRSAARATR